MSKSPIYNCFPLYIPIFLPGEIDLILLNYLNHNLQDVEVIKKLVDLFEIHVTLKEGRTHEVVLKGNELLEAFLQEDIELFDCGDVEEIEKFS